MADSERQMKPGDKVLVRATVREAAARANNLLGMFEPEDFLDFMDEEGADTDLIETRAALRNALDEPLPTPEEVRAMAEEEWDKEPKTTLPNRTMTLIRHRAFLTGFEAAYRRLTGESVKA